MDIRQTILKSQVQNIVMVKSLGIAFAVLNVSPDPIAARITDHGIGSLF